MTASVAATSGLEANAASTAAILMGERAVAWLEERGHRVRLPTDAAALLGRQALGCDHASLPPALDVAVAIGGDVTLLPALPPGAYPDPPLPSDHPLATGTQPPPSPNVRS